HGVPPFLGALISTRHPSRYVRIRAKGGPIKQTHTFHRGDKQQRVLSKSPSNRIGNGGPQKSVHASSKAYRNHGRERNLLSRVFVAHRCCLSKAQYRRRRLSRRLFPIPNKQHLE